MNREPGRQQGTVLLPVVAALVILSIAGTALTELFAAQRMSVMGSVESSQAFWAAEAGIWHASLGPSDVSAPVTLGGTTYTVTQADGTDLVSAVRNQTTRVVSGSVSVDSGLKDSGEPLDEVACAASAWQHSTSHLHLALVSDHVDDAIIRSFTLAVNRPTPNVTSFKLGGVELLASGTSVPLPTGNVIVTAGLMSERTVASGSFPDAMISFAGVIASSTRLFTLVIDFTDGSRSTVDFTVTW